MKLRQYHFFIALVIFILSSCGSKETNQNNPSFQNYIQAYTSSLISVEDKIVVRLSQPVRQSVSDDVLQDLFDFSPGIEGKTRLINGNTLEFYPSERLDQNTEYTASLELHELFEVSDELKEFVFRFQTIAQDYTVLVEGLEAEDILTPEVQQLIGKVNLADVADTNDLYLLLSAQHEGESKEIRWTQINDKQYQFAVQNIRRQDQKTQIVLSANGDKIDVDKDLDLDVEVSALGDFEVSSVTVNQGQNQFVTIWFSDPVADQNLDGLITLGDLDNLEFVIKGNKVLIYPSERLSGKKPINISQGIKSTTSYKTSAVFRKDLLFEQFKPQVQLLHSGQILPSSDQLVLPFRAVSLKYVDVIIKRVYQNNILQFFQDNDYDDDYRLNRVGRIIKRKRVDLSAYNHKNLQTWNHFYLDLKDIVEVEPGAIYKVDIRFKKEYSLYSCSDDESEESNVSTVENYSDDDWDGEPDLDDYSYHYYNWDERENPCHEAYYSSSYGNALVSTNLLASNLGLSVKIGGNRVAHAYVTDLISAQPMGGVMVEFYDYQQQLIAGGQTDGDGMISMNLSRKPFMAMATSGSQKAYVKLQDGNSLSLSKFDVEGSAVDQGVKGFMYTERGVWRPGDSTYLMFMLEDKENLIPEQHPVIFELFNPQNKLVTRKVNSQSVNGIYDFIFKTHEDDITGYYTAYVKIGNRRFTKSIRIETVKPNRLKVEHDFDQDVLYSSEDNAEGTLKVRWLHGATAQNLKAKTEVIVTAARTSFKGFKGFTFDDASKDFDPVEKIAFDGKLDSSGEGDLETELDNLSTPGMVWLNYKTKAFEPGGNFSIGKHQIKYSPYESYVGMSIPEGTLFNGTLVTDESHTVEVVNLTEKGKPVANQKVKVEVYKLSWRWWWDSYRDNIGTYISQSSVIPVYKTEVKTNGEGKATFNLQINQPDWGRFFVRVIDTESGHVAGKTIYIDWPYWARSNRKNSDQQSLLAFSTNKETFETDETVEVTFPSAEGAKALVTIETGTKILDEYWVSTDKGETKISFQTTPEMAPNAYIHITHIQPHAQTENNRPIRMYGVIPLFVKNPETELKPVIEMPDVLRPETTIEVTVSEEENRDMAYTIALVDEGLLDLTNFKTPNPWKHFYAREALGVKTWDMYDYVIGAFGGEFERLISIGGDGSLSNKEDRKANRFKPMVRFIGPFEYTGGKKTHEISIPNYVGSVRAMVVAGNQKAYGSIDKTVPVRNPLMVLATLPRQLGPGEEVDVPVSVFAMEDHVKDVTVKLENNDIFEVLGSNKQRISFDKPGEQLVTFKLRVKKEVGIGTVKVLATSGKEKARDEVELQVRVSNPVITEVKDTILSASSSINFPVDWYGVKGTNNASITVSTIPNLGIEERLKYLIRYPHGCVEQTTSAVFPQLFLDNLFELSSEKQDQIDQNIKHGINRLVSFQTANGGFAYWPNQQHSSSWGSNYAGHFLIEAKQKGYAIPVGLLENWAKYQRKEARNWGMSSTNTNVMTQAYRLYILALYGTPELGAMNRLRENNKLNPTAKWQLGAAYALAGQEAAAEVLLNSATTQLDRSKPYAYGYSYGSYLRDEAMILESLTLLNKRDQGFTILKAMAKQLSSRNWYSTQTTAYSLMAISKFVGKNAGERELTFTIKQGGKTESINAAGSVYTFEFTPSSTNGESVKVTSESGNELFVRRTIEGRPMEDNRDGIAQNLSIKVTFKDTKGNTIFANRLPQGLDFIAQIQVSNTGPVRNINNLALEHMFPSGWEIINTRMDDATTYRQSSMQYQDIRDDRVYTYLNLSGIQTKTYYVMLNASYTGKFYMPTVVVSDMYDDAIQARIKGMWVEVEATE